MNAISEQDASSPKSELRQKLLKRRNSLSVQQQLIYSQRALKLVQTWLKVFPCSDIFLFYPFRNEIDLRGLLNDPSAPPLHLPRILDYKAAAMDFFTWSKETELQLNRFGIWEPEVSKGKGPQVVKPSQDSLLLIPCLGVDRQGFRLGYGGGYFDRYLQRNPLGHRMGVCLSSELLISSARQSHDQALNWLLTESWLLRFEVSLVWRPSSIA